MLESVPNFSEGRCRATIERILEPAYAVPGARVLDWSSDADHHRTVVTLVGEPGAVLQAVKAMTARAVDLIDLRRHRGSHPRIGAMDVIPLVPLGEMPMQEAVELAHSLAAELAETHGIPVYLYGEAATRPERRDLSRVREGQFEGLSEAIRQPERRPDCGPARLHPTAGAVAVGARGPLIAYNVNLATADLAVAKRIARQVRESSGGLPAVKAIGLALTDRGQTQVSMNLTDFRRTSLGTAFQAVAEAAAAMGVSVVESEIVGLVPAEALLEEAARCLRLRSFESRQVLELRLLEEDAGAGSHAGGHPQQGRVCELDKPIFGQMNLTAFVEQVASASPAPGGGTVSAVAGALAGALVAMVARLSLAREVGVPRDELERLVAEAEAGWHRLLELSSRDTEAYLSVLEAYRLPKGSEEERARRRSAIEAALRQAAEIPLEVAGIARELLAAAQLLGQAGYPPAATDAQVAALLARAAIAGALANVRVNLESMRDAEIKAVLHSRLAELEAGQ